MLLSVINVHTQGVAPMLTWRGGECRSLGGQGQVLQVEALLEVSTAYPPLQVIKI